MVSCVEEDFRPCQISKKTNAKSLKVIEENEEEGSHFSIHENSHVVSSKQISHNDFRIKDQITEEFGQ